MVRAGAILLTISSVLSSSAQYQRISPQRWYRKRRRGHQLHLPQPARLTTLEEQTCNGRAIGSEIVSEHQGEFTTVLRRWSGGDARAREELVDRVYAELKQLARARFAGERAGHTLQPTALVHETYLKLVQGEQVSWQDRVHFIAVSARIMRQILVDSGRRRSAAKRQRDPGDVLLVQAGARDDDTVDILALDQAMARLEALDPAQARVVELRYFGGLTIEETAAAMEISVATVNRYWRAARAWLYLQLNPAHDP